MRTPVMTLAILLVLPAAAGAAVPTTGEFDVSPSVNDGRYYPAPALDPDGDLTVVYRGPYNEQDEEAEPNLVLRRFSCCGSTLVNTGYPTVSPELDTMPSVDAEPDGTLVATWLSWPLEEGQAAPNDPAEVRARRLDPTQSPPDMYVTNRIDVYTHEHKDSFGAPSVVLDAAGGSFTIVWPFASDCHVEGGCQSRGVMARRYNANGTPMGPAAELEGIASFIPLAIEAAPTPGGFVLAFAGIVPGEGGGADFQVFFRRFAVTDDEISPVGQVASANADPAGMQETPSVSADSAGGFTIAWREGRPAGEDIDYDIEARRFGASGLPVSGDLDVSQGASLDQHLPDIGSAPDGDFAVSWTDGEVSPTPDLLGVSTVPAPGPPAEVMLREYNAEGAPRGGEIKVNEAGEGDIPDSGSEVAYGSDDAFVVAWARGTMVAPSGTPYRALSGRILARRYATSGDTVQGPVDPGGTGNAGGPGNANLPSSAGTLIDLPRSLPVDRQGRVKIELDCPAQLPPTCDPLVEGVSTSKVAASIAARRPKKRLLRLGRRRYSIPQGTSRTVTFKLSRRAFRYLKRKRKLRVRFIVTGGGARNSDVTTLRAPKRRKR